MNKAEILSRLESSRRELLEAIDELTPGQVIEPGAVGTWSVRDVLQHLSLWEAELVRLFVHLQRGTRPTGGGFAARPDFDAINARWQAETKDRPLEHVMEDLHGVRRQVSRWIDGMSDEDLSRRRSERWLRREPLWKWIADYSFEHEKEHLAHVRAYREKIEASGTPRSGGRPQGEVER